jgi:hypothetical protein
MISAGRKVKVNLQGGGTVEGTLEFRYIVDEGIVLKDRTGKTVCIPARSIFYVKER